MISAIGKRVHSIILC